MKIHIVIATHGRASLLHRTLTSLSDCVLPDGLERVIVVENGIKYAAEETIAGFREDLPVLYLYHPAANKSMALNHALEQIEDGLIMFFDDDVRFAPGTLLAYVSCVQQSGRPCFWGGPLGVDYEEPPPEWIRAHLPRSAKGWALADPVRQEPDWFLGANWAAMAGDLRRAGGFDEKFGPGSKGGARGQETHMQSKLREAGLVPEYVQDALVFHYVPKERCSPEWLLARRRQEGAGYGNKENHRHVLRRVAVTCFTLSALAYNTCLRTIFRAVNSPKRVYHYEMRLNVYRGMLSTIKIFSRARKSLVSRIFS